MPYSLLLKKHNASHNKEDHNVSQCYHQRTGPRLVNVHKKLVKVGHVVLEIICEWTEEQTHRQTDRQTDK